MRWRPGSPGTRRPWRSRPTPAGQALAVGAVGAARRHLEAAIDLAGSTAPAELVFDLGRALIASPGDHQAGVARYQELLARADLPGDLRLAVLVQLSHAHMAAGLITEAETVLDEAVRLAGPGSVTWPPPPWSTTPPRSW